ncbi:MAG: phosphatase PAP2 family protein [Deltaproteobacteria bacterium]|nr:phosphatase PAP2 family protein [Deltaproteobacteria bacterium]
MSPRPGAPWDRRGVVHTLLAPEPAAPDLPWALRALRAFAVQDWLIVGYFLVLLGAVLAGTGPARDQSVRNVALSLAVVLLGLAVVRGEVLPWGTRATALFYRLSVVGPVMNSYFLLRYVLPTANPSTRDAQILAFDLRVFGYEPALAWDRYVTPATVEWFSFFYFGYFIIITLYLEGNMFFAKNSRLLAEVALGAFFIFCFGHVTYMLVPGFGPYHHLAGTFQHELTGGTFWGMVQDTVRSAGAQKDIFPSLHTAVPTFLCIFAWRNRAVAPYNFVWLPTTLFTSQIIIATMFLRWHYLVDIFAGLAFAAFAGFVVPRILAWEHRRREAMGVMPVWTPLWTLPSLRRR